MLYAILCYDSEEAVGAWTAEQEAAVMGRLLAVQAGLAEQGRMGPVARLLPTTAATTVRKGQEPLVLDGPFAETKEQLLGFYLIDCALAGGGAAGGKGPGGGQRRRHRRLRGAAGPDLPAGRCPIVGRTPVNGQGGMSELAWLDAALAGARPRAVGALLRYFGNLDLAEEAFQEASLRALRSWPRNGPPRDAAAWLILVGRNAGIDLTRRRAKETELPPEEALSDLEDAEAAMAERLDGADYRDDVLRLLFTCCHPELPATQQIALALRIVCGLTVPQIARAFLVGTAAMEQRITRAKARIAQAGPAL